MELVIYTVSVVVLQNTFEKNGASKFWRHFDPYSNVAVLEIDKDPVRLCNALA